jgi:hypothetical protein
VPRLGSTVLAALLCAAAARAQDPAPPPREPPHFARQEELTPEDRELVKDLALLEQLELVKNLELFEPEKDDAGKPRERQP